MPMRYFLPALMVFALALPASGYASGGRECGPHLQQQIDQARKSAEYAAVLAKQQAEQAAKSTAYGAELAKGQAEQAKKSAEYGAVLAKQQADQAAKSTAYGAELAKQQADQARRSAEYGAKLAVEQRKILQYYASLCDEQTTKFDLKTPPPRVREAAVEPPLKGYIASGTSVEPPPPLPTGGLPTASGSPVTPNNALDEPKPSLDKALGDVQKQQ